MEYSIQQLSRLAGVTTRTLRWYDKIDLLKPSRTAQNGYRYYGSKEVDRLQDILFYRALGVELAQIKKCLDSPSFDRLSALKNHLKELETRQTQLCDLIQAVKNTIQAEERNEIMTDEKKFEAFKQNALEQYEQCFEQEARTLYGDESVDSLRANILNLTPQQYQEWTELGNTIFHDLEEAVHTKLSPSDKAGKKIVKMHRRWLTISNNKYDAQEHRGLAKLYLADQRFTAYYDRTICGCAQFLHDAILYWTE